MWFITLTPLVIRETPVKISRLFSHDSSIGSGITFLSFGMFRRLQDEDEPSHCHLATALSFPCFLVVAWFLDFSSKFQLFYESISFSWNVREMARGWQGEGKRGWREDRSGWWSVVNLSFSFRTPSTSSLAPEGHRVETASGRYGNKNRK